MNPTGPRSLDLPYRIFRRIEREVRQRACGFDLGIDRGIAALVHRRVESRRRFGNFSRFAPWGDGKRLQELLASEVTAEERAAVVAAGERAVRHTFDLLGSGPVELGSSIDWHRDFKSGYSWCSRTHFTRVRQAVLSPGADIKVPWELSRCQHFSALGLSDRITGDPKYYEEFKAQTVSWLEANPYGTGVNWACAMDVGIRAVNWLNAAMLFEHRIREDGDENFFKDLERSLWMHGWYIRRNLEWSGPRGGLGGNHLLADLTGLLAIGLLFRDTGTGRRWFRFAKFHLEREMLRQVRADGCNHENSTSYHRLVMEMFEWSAAVSARAESPFSKSYETRLEAMRGFVDAYSAPSGIAVQFGDNDSGRLICAGIGNPSDHRYLTAAECGFGGSLDRLLLSGRSAGEPESNAAGDWHQGFPDGGFWFARRGPAWLGMRAGAYAEGGGHSHCDQLSIVLNVAGREILVDRGTGIYTPDPEKRNRYRSTASHNTFQVNGWEQSRIESGRAAIFRLPDQARTEVVEWSAAGETVRLVGQHHGCETERPGMLCRRTATLCGEQLSLVDQITGLKEGDRIDWAFHLMPGCSVELSEGRARIRAGSIIVEMVWPSSLSARVEPSAHSPAYGVEETAGCLRLATVFDRNGPGEFPISLHWKNESGAGTSNHLPC
jgi:hypothetical protein